MLFRMIYLPRPQIPYHYIVQTEACIFVSLPVPVVSYEGYERKGVSEQLNDKLPTPKLCWLSKSPTQWP